MTLAIKIGVYLFLFWNALIAYKVCREMFFPAKPKQAVEHVRDNIFRINPRA